MSDVRDSTAVELERVRMCLAEAGHPDAFLALGTDDTDHAADCDRSGWDRP